MLLSDQSAPAFVPSSYELHSSYPLNNDQIHALVRFYLETSGHEKLIGRVDNLRCNLALGIVTSAYITHQNTIIASAIGYAHDDNIYEIGSVLIDPEYKGKGLYKDLRHAHINLGKGKTTVMFERLASVKKPRILAQRALEGWRELSFHDPVFQAVEATKIDEPHRKPPKTGLVYIKSA